MCIQISKKIQGRLSKTTKKSDKNRKIKKDKKTTLIKLTPRQDDELTFLRTIV